jgi:superfamily II DNA or RNA helicase
MQMTMSQVNKIKDTEQRHALNMWAKTGFVGSIIAGTGFGKSRCGVLAAGKTLRDHIEGEGRGIVLVPTVQLRDQFEEEFSKWGYEDVVDKIDFVCYQSAYKLKDNHYNIVVCDEVHLGLSPEYRKFFENNTYDRLLCMTATLPEENEYKLHLFKLAPTVYRISLDQCVAMGLVSPYDIVCVPIKLTDEEQKEYKSINKKFVYWKYQLGQFGAFDAAKAIMANKNASAKDKQAAARFYACIRDRKKIVDFASNKVAQLQKLVIQNLDSKMLVFGGANAFTDTLCDATQPFSVSYHSGKTKKQRENALLDFKEGNKNVLCSTKALNQGLDVPDASVGVVCGLTSKALPMIQRIGRLIRFQEDKKGRIYILYVKDSQEEKWLKSSVKGLKNITWLPS